MLVQPIVTTHEALPPTVSLVLNVRTPNADTADRFINSKCVKYMLRAGEIEKAEETAGMFTRESTDPIAQLSEMQCIWFETETAKAYIQALDSGMALKKLHAIAGHFETMVEDQFDFHTCVGWLRHLIEPPI